MQICTTTFTLLRSCHELLDGSRWLHADYSLSCDAEGWRAKQALALCSLIIYALGIPVFYFVLLYWKRDSLFSKVSQHDQDSFYSEYDGLYYTMDEDQASQLGFLYAAYEPARAPCGC